MKNKLPFTQQKIKRPKKTFLLFFSQNIQNAIAYKYNGCQQKNEK